MIFLLLLSVSLFHVTVQLNGFTYCAAKTPTEGANEMCRKYCQQGRCMEYFCTCLRNNTVDTCSPLYFAPHKKVAINETIAPGTTIFSINVTGAETWEYMLGRGGTVDGSVWSLLSNYLQLVKNGAKYDMVVKTTPDLEDIFHLKGIKLTVLTLQLKCLRSGMSDEDHEIFVEIIPVNEHAPEFFPKPLKQTVPENTPVKSKIYELSQHAIDLDVNTRTRELSYFGVWNYLNNSKLDGRTYFQMQDIGKGTILLTKALDFEALQPIGSTQLFLNLSATDSQGVTSFATLTVEVEDVDDLPPEFYDPECPQVRIRTRPCLVSYHATVPLNYKGQITEIQPDFIRARDMDTFDNPVEFFLEPGPGESQANVDKFEMDNTTGVVTVRSPFTSQTEINLVVVARELSDVGRTTQALLRIKARVSSPLNPHSIRNEEDVKKAKNSFKDIDRTVLIIIITLVILCMILLGTMFALCAKLKQKRATARVEPLPVRKESALGVNDGQKSTVQKDSYQSADDYSYVSSTLQNNPDDRNRSARKGGDRGISSDRTQSSAHDHSSFSSPATAYIPVVNSNITGRNSAPAHSHLQTPSPALQAPEREKSEQKRSHTGNAQSRGEDIPQSRPPTGHIQSRREDIHQDNSHTGHIQSQKEDVYQSRPPTGHMQIRRKDIHPGRPRTGPIQSRREDIHQVRPHTEHIQRHREDIHQGRPHTGPIQSRREDIHQVRPRTEHILSRREDIHQGRPYTGQINHRREDIHQDRPHTGDIQSHREDIQQGRPHTGHIRNCREDIQPGRPYTGNIKSRKEDLHQDRPHTGNIKTRTEDLHQERLHTGYIQSRREDIHQGRPNTGHIQSRSNTRYDYELMDLPKRSRSATDIRNPALEKEEHVTEMIPWTEKEQECEENEVNSRRSQEERRQRENSRNEGKLDNKQTAKLLFPYQPLTPESVYQKNSVTPSSDDCYDPESNGPTSSYCPTSTDASPEFREADQRSFLPSANTNPHFREADQRSALPSANSDVLSLLPMDKSSPTSNGDSTTDVPSEKVATEHDPRPVFTTKDVLLYEQKYEEHQVPFDSDTCAVKAENNGTDKHAYNHGGCDVGTHQRASTADPLWSGEQRRDTEDRPKHSQQMGDYVRDVDCSKQTLADGRLRPYTCAGDPGRLEEVTPDIPGRPWTGLSPLKRKKKKKKMLKRPQNLPEISDFNETLAAGPAPVRPIRMFQTPDVTEQLEVSVALEVEQPRKPRPLPSNQGRRRRPVDPSIKYHEHEQSEISTEKYANVQTSPSSVDKKVFIDRSHRQPYMLLRQRHIDDQLRQQNLHHSQLQQRYHQPQPQTPEPETSHASIYPDQFPQMENVPGFPTASSSNEMTPEALRKDAPQR